MGQQFVGEIRCFGFNFAPFQWAQCNGQLMSIQQNTALFSLLGTYYGGNGTSTFQLPNLQGQVPMHWGNGIGLSQYVLGETTGSPTVALNQSEMPAHNHTITVAVNASGGQGERGPTPSANSYLGPSLQPDAVWVNAPNQANTQFAQNAISPYAGQGQPHDNMQPYLTLNFCIALFGVYPARN